MDNWAQCPVDQLDSFAGVSWFLSEHPFDHKHIATVLGWVEFQEGVGNRLDMVVEGGKDALAMLIDEIG